MTPKPFIHPEILLKIKETVGGLAERADQPTYNNARTSGQEFADNIIKQMFALLNTVSSKATSILNASVPAAFPIFDHRSLVFITNGNVSIRKYLTGQNDRTKSAPTLSVEAVHCSVFFSKRK